MTQQQCNRNYRSKSKNSKYTVYIGRGSKWRNPFSHKVDTRATYRVKTRKEAILKYEEWIIDGLGKHLLDFLPELKGQTLGCFCKLHSCHGIFLKN